MITRLLSCILLSAVPAISSGAEKPGKPAPGTGEQCLAVLRDGLESEEFWPAMHAAEALTLAGCGAEVRELLEPKLAAESDDRQRCGLARELVRAGDRKQIRVLFSVLESADPYGHVHAAESLYKVGFDRDPAPLERHFRESDDIRLRLMAAAALAKHTRAATRDEAFAFLRETLREEPDPEIFRLAAWVLGRIGSPGDRERIRERLPDTRTPLQQSFLQNSLALLGDPEAQAIVLQNLKSKDPAIRTYAAIFAGEAGLQEAASLLLQQLTDKDLDARIRAAQGLILLSR